LGLLSPPPPPPPPPPSPPPPPPYPLFESGPQSKEVFIKSGYELMLKRSI